jgi:hypothetical protein
MSRYYPYFRYDGFTDHSEQKKWKVVLDERLEDWLTYKCQQHRHPQAAQSALDKILAFDSHAKTSVAGRIIRALALKESGQTAAAGQLMDSLPASSVDEKALAAWGKEILAGNAATLPDTLQNPETRILAAWLRQSMNP